MRRPSPADAALALGLTVLLQIEVWGTGAHEARAAATLLITLPLLARRTAPVAAVAAVGAGLVAPQILGIGDEPETALLAIFVAAFSVGAHARQRAAFAGGGLLLLAVFVQEPEDFIVLGPAVAGSFGLGVVLHRYREQAARLRELTRVLERERAEHARLALAEERARIGRELHDVVAHSVSVIVMQAGAERLTLGGERPQTAEVLASIERTGRQALAEMRRVVGMLRVSGTEPELAPLPSLDHLDSLVERMRDAGLAVELRWEGPRVELAPGLDATAFRIVQEALTNVLKHAGPATASVAVRYGTAAVELEITDAGRGAAGVNGSGHGHIGMRERAALYGGSVEVGPRAEGGYGVLARLPLGPAAR